MEHTEDFTPAVQAGPEGEVSTTQETRSSPPPPQTTEALALESSPSWLPMLPGPEVRGSPKAVAKGDKGSKGGPSESLSKGASPVYPPPSTSQPQSLASNHGRTEASRASLAEWSENRQVQR